jgi:glucuronoarabinoxylan endo-1,4-beta-xylanase
MPNNQENKMKRKMTICLAAVMAVFSFITLVNAAATDVTVNVTSTHQIIRGFGASSAWCGAMSDAVFNGLYTDLGYSILRLRIEDAIGDAWQSGNYSSWANELSNAKKAIARGAIVFASPWNPPASMMSGGKLSTSQYGNYANYLKAFAKYCSDNGAALYAISIQNEPDYGTSGGWCAWTATDMLNFLTSYGSTISSSYRLMMPESFHFDHAMSDPSLNNSTVASYISIIGGHTYGATIQDYPLARNMGKEIWMTEKYFDDDTIANIMSLAKEMHDCMVTGNMNAYVYWWITWANGLSTSSGSLYKRAYVIGQFSKYIRPGFYRVDATATPATGVYVSAYTDNNQVVVVAVNTNTSSVSQNFVFQNGAPTQVSSYITNSGSNMTTGSSLTLSGTGFTATLQAQSITTFLGIIGSVVTPAPTAVPTVGPTPVPGTVSIACGNSSAVGDFQPDQYYSGGSTFNNTNTVDVSAITSNPPPAALFSNERYGAMSYTIPGFTAGSTYSVTLYFAETYLTSSGSRVFNASINGSAVLANFDIYATAGGQNKAVAKSFMATADGSGQIAIQFTSVTENPKINGISIIPNTNNGTRGDVNGSGTIDIVDALLIAQYYVGLNPSGFVAANADVNCTGTIDIVDALLVAQYYVGLVSSLSC